MNKIEIILLTVILLLAFIIRLYRIDGPIADWHSWRQADTASITRNFIKEGFTPFYPKFDTLNSLNDGQVPNPNRYFFAEFPLYNILTYPLYYFFGVNEIFARLISIIASTLTVLVLFFLVRFYSSSRVALFASFFYAVLPFSIYYGRVILPDPLYILFSVLTLYLVTRWLHSDKIWWVPLAGIAAALAILTKPYALVLIIPIAYLWWRRWAIKTPIKISVYVFLAIAIIPFMIWRWHINQYPEGMFSTGWLFNAGNIRFTGSFFRWLIYDRMNRLIFATGGFVLFWLGIIKKPNHKEGLFYYAWLAAILVYFVVIAKGNVTHDYYQMPLVPIGCIFMAKGVDFLLLYGTNLYQRIFYALVAMVLILLMLAFGWFEVRDFFNINHPEIVAAGKAVDRLLPKDAKVITPYQNDPAFLYQTNRYGWTVGGDRIPEFIKEGATHLVSVNFDDDTNYWMQRCTIVARDQQWVIINLLHCKVDK